MQSSDHSIHSGLHIDPYAATSIKSFLVKFNQKLESFVELLQREQTTLMQGSADEISQTAQYKSDYMQELSQYVANYFSNASEKINTNLEEALKLMDIICVEKKIIEWTTSKKLIQLCRELSDKNSILLANRLKSTTSALDTLYSLTGSQQTKTYDDRGHSSNDLRSRQLASV